MEASQFLANSQRGAPETHGSFHAAAAQRAERGRLKVALLSLRANPAFVQHLIAFAKAIQELGGEVEFLLDPNYACYSDLAATACVRSLDATRERTDLTHAIFINPAVENRSTAQRMAGSGVRVIYIYHEPWQMSWKYLRDEGLSATLRAIVAHRFTIPVLKLAEKVILESEFGMARYLEADKRYNTSCHVFPQIYDDEAPEHQRLVCRKVYFSYIGNLCAAHGFDQFQQTASYALKCGLDMKFLVASRHPLPATFLEDPVLNRNRDKIELRCGRSLSSAEINMCYAESQMVWNVYRRSTQSGVLPKAFMFGAPVLASRVGSFPECVSDKYNGRFVSGDRPEEILAAAAHIRENLRQYAENCRHTFLQKFYYKANLSSLGVLLDISAGETGDMKDEARYAHE